MLTFFAGTALQYCPVNVLGLHGFCRDYGSRFPSLVQKDVNHKSLKQPGSLHFGEAVVPRVMTSDP